MTGLVKKLDAAAVRHADAPLCSFVVFCSDEDGLEARLKKLADENHLKKVVLAIDNPAGPRGYNIAKDADVTVMLYTDYAVKVNHAFKKGELTEAAVDAVVSDLKAILPTK